MFSSIVTCISSDFGKVSPLDFCHFSRNVPPVQFVCNPVIVTIIIEDTQMNGIWDERQM